MHGIERDRMQAWRIKRVFGRTSQRFALRHVLYPASAVKRRAEEMQHHYVVQMVHRLHRIWFMRVKDLLTRRLWKPGDVDATAQTDLWTFRRVMHCRPSCVCFKGGNRGRIRPCAQYKLCPFCWGRVAAFLYRRFKGRILRTKKQHTGAILYCRVSAQFVPVDGFAQATGLSADSILANARKLKDIFDQHRAAYQKHTKKLQRNTLGSAWRVVVNPQDSGWSVEVRQIALMRRPRRVPPFVKPPGAARVFDMSVRIDDDEKVYDLLGRFLQYPAGLLMSYAELTAVYLQAGYRVRLTSGTGLFRTCGSGLARAFREDKRSGEPKEERQERADIGAMAPDLESN
jgi:hypothetical protein